MRINARYYGWRFVLYLAAIFTASAVVAGVVVHVLFVLLGLVPERRGDIGELATFGLDYTLVLNVLALSVAGVLVWRTPLLIS